MIRMSGAELLQLFPQADAVADSFAFAGVEIDSRKPCDGRLFIAIKGERFDGHDFVAAARDKGAVAALVESRVDAEIPQLVVGDTRMAMGQLALNWRRKLGPKVIAITGSNGKTTVKEMLGRILGAQQPTLVTQGNLNNDIGVPLTLFRLAADQPFAVIEMGTNHRHEIRYMLGIAEPDIVFVNNAGAAHVEGFGSLQGVIEAKGEMYQFCRPQALAVFNEDEAAVDYWRSVVATSSQLSFSSDHQADVTAQVELTSQGIRLEIRHAGQRAQCRLDVHGAHNAQNALAAISLALLAVRQARLRRQLLAILGAGLCVGMAVGTKFTGLTSAAGLILGSGLILNWLLRHGHRPELGLPEHYDSYAEYLEHVQILQQAGMIEDATVFWWDLRPSDRYPTLEMRITDMCTDIDDAIAIAALTQSLLHYLHRLRKQHMHGREFHRFLVSQNRWRAIRYGYDEGFVDFTRRSIVPIGELLPQIVEMVSEDAQALDCVDELQQLLRIPERGTSAHQQLAIYQREIGQGHNQQTALNAVVDFLIEKTVETGKS